MCSATAPALSGDQRARDQRVERLRQPGIERLGRRRRAGGDRGAAADRDERVRLQRPGFRRLGLGPRRLTAGTLRTPAWPPRPVGRVASMYIGIGTLIVIIILLIILL